MTYNNTTGIITYVGPSESETAHFSGGTGVDITDGVVSIGQSVATDAVVTFTTVNANVTGQVNYDISNHDTNFWGLRIKQSILYSSEITGSLSVTDSGGDGSLAYDISSGVITYTGPWQLKQKSPFFWWNRGRNNGWCSINRSECFYY